MEMGEGVEMGGEWMGDAMLVRYGHKAAEALHRHGRQGTCHVREGTNHTVPKKSTYSTMVH